MMAKPYNVLVDVRGDLPAAIKRFSKLVKSELAPMLKATSPRYMYDKPSVLRKRKSAKARQRVRKAAQARAMTEARRWRWED